MTRKRWGSEQVSSLRKDFKIKSWSLTFKKEALFHDVGQEVLPIDVYVLLIWVRQAFLVGKSLNGRGVTFCHSG
jgi:hypothetical protein